MNIRPTYTITRYTDQVYKVVRSKVLYLPDHSKRDRQKFVHSDSKLEHSLSRTRKTILELALCNPWKYFCTFTFSPTYNRFDIEEIRKKFTRYCKYLRECGYQFKYVFVPERHEDGAWHIHGLVDTDIPLILFDDVDFPVDKKLLGKGYSTSLLFKDKFGFNSFGCIRHHTASAFYISKYISKDNTRLVTDISKRIIWSCKGLNKSVKVEELYGRDPDLDRYITQEYEFCAVGMTKVSHNLDWTFPLQFAQETVSFAQFMTAVRSHTAVGFFEGMDEINGNQLSFDIA